VALPAGEVAVVRGDHWILVRPRRERSLMLVRITVPFPPGEVRRARAGLLTALTPREVGASALTLLSMLRAVLIVLHSHCGLRFTSFVRDLPTSRSTSSAAAATDGTTATGDDRQA